MEKVYHVLHSEHSSESHTMHCSTSFDTRAHFTSTNNLIICRRVSRRYSSILFFFGTSLIDGNLSSTRGACTILRLCQIEKLSITLSYHPVADKTDRYTPGGDSIERRRRRVVPYPVPIAVAKGCSMRLGEPWFLGGLIVDRLSELLHG